MKIKTLINQTNSPLQSINSGSKRFSILNDKEIPLTSDNIDVHRMSPSDLEIVLSWACKESWNPGQYEAKSLHTIDPRGYFLLEIDNNPIAGLAGIKYTPNQGFLGLYLVKEEYRKRGFGIHLWNIAMGYLKDCSCIGLNAVVNQIKNYEKYGFISASQNFRWTGVPTNEKLDKSVSEFLTIPSDKLFQEIFEYDWELLHFDREKFLREWLNMPLSNTLTFIDNNKIRGFGVISKCIAGYKIGPLFADNLDIAEDIFAGLCIKVGKDKSVQIDTNENSPMALRLARNFGLVKTFTTMRMYRGEPLEVDPDKIFGLTSLEVG